GPRAFARASMSSHAATLLRCSTPRSAPILAVTPWRGEPSPRLAKRLALACSRVPDVLQLLPHRGGGAETYIDLLEGGRYRHERVAFSTSRSWLAGSPSIAWHVPVVAWKARSFDVVHAHGDVAAMLALPALTLRRSVWSPQGLHLLRRAQGRG